MNDEEKDIIKNNYMEAKKALLDFISYAEKEECKISEVTITVMVYLIRQIGDDLYINRSQIVENIDSNAIIASIADSLQTLSKDIKERINKKNFNKI